MKEAESKGFQMSYTLFETNYASLNANQKFNARALDPRGVRVGSSVAKIGQINFS